MLNRTVASELLMTEVEQSFRPVFGAVLSELVLRVG